MKAFYFFDEDDIDNLPADFELLPLDASYLDAAIALSEVQKPKTWPSEKSPKELKSSV